jgi:hypothetical protein
MDDKKIREFINEEVQKAIKNQPKDKIPKMQFFVNIAMVIVTIIYAFLTFLLYQTTSELNSIGVRPYVAFQNMEILPGMNEANEQGLMFRIRLKNVGNGIANYKVTNADYL